jgi:hypothetical protein
MVEHLSGTRANDQRYPPPGYNLECDDWEGQNLVHSGVAVRVTMPESKKDWVGYAVEQGADPKEAASSTGAELKAEYGPEPEAVPEAAEPEPAPEPASEPAPEPEPESHDKQAWAGYAVEAPAPHDNKQAWVDYAVSQGADPTTAARQTKADLQSRYGPRL